MVTLSVVTLGSGLSDNFNWGGGILPSQNSKCKDLPKFQFSGGGGGIQNSKCQDLPKLQLSGGGILYFRIEGKL